MPGSYETDDGKIDHAKRAAVLTRRFQEEDNSFKTEQEQWEENQIAASLMKVDLNSFFILMVLFFLFSFFLSISAKMILMGFQSYSYSIMFRIFLIPFFFDSLRLVQHKQKTSMS